MKCWNPKIIMVIIMAISSQALGSTVLGTREGSETRSLTSAMNNDSHERPTAQWVEDIVQSRLTERSGRVQTARTIESASLIKPAHGNIVAQETVNGTMHLLRILESALFYADNDLSSLQFDGYLKLMTENAPAANIIDLRGLPLSEDNLTDGALTVSDAPNYGRATNLNFGSLSQKRALSA